jgi:phage terminase Nu1 subunit (DNA packaging protein)
MPRTAAVPAPAASPPLPAVRILTQQELATTLKRSIQTVRRWVTLGMPTLGVGHGVRPLFDVDAVLAWLAASSPPAAPSGNGRQVKRRHGKAARRKA